MISHISSVQIFVSDQDRALKFYTEKLGFELRSDQPMGPSAPRWLEVGLKGSQTVLVLYKPSPEMPGADTYEKALSLVGSFAPFVLNVEDMEATHKTLAARGVEFPTPPEKQFYGWWATLKDSEGNTLGLHAN